jgi:hypothetical protein
MTIEYVKYEDLDLAIIISDDHQEDGVRFVTPENYSQQLAYMHHDSGWIIKPHTHLLSQKKVEFTQEVLVIKRGRLRVDFYDTNCEYIKSRILKTGDIILLAFAGHGFEVLEELEMIEIKQGPYSGETADKRKFDPVSSEKINFD